MLEGIITSIKRTNEYDMDEEAKDFIRRYIKDPTLLDVKGLHSNLSQDLKNIYSKNNTQIIEMLPFYLDQAFEKIKTYKLPDKSPFEVLDDPDTMILRNGLITIGAKANTGKTSLVTHLSLEIMRANPKTCFIFFSLDDNRRLGLKRILTQITKKNYVKNGQNLKESTDVCLDLTYTDDTDEAKSSDERLIRVSKNKIGTKGQVYITAITQWYLFEKLEKYTKSDEGKTPNKRSPKNMSWDAIRDRIPE